MKINPEDKVDEINYIDVALRMVGINTNYQSAELIKFTLDKVKELGGEMTIMDASKLQTSHEKYWNDYFERQEKNRK